MRVLIQRVSASSVSAEGQEARHIGPGLVILLGVAKSDTVADIDYLVDKTMNLRVFNDDDGKMNRSLLDVGGEALIVSQFTLYGDTRKGRRPGFSDAGLPQTAEPLYEAFAEAVTEAGIHVERGWFGTHMKVDIHNDGPVTLMLESPQKDGT